MIEDEIIMMENQLLSDDLDQRGKPHECKFCGAKFKFKTYSEKEIWKKTKLKCPACNVEYSTIHETDRKLLALQEQYFLSDRDNKYLELMYPILYDYTKSIILKSFRKAIMSLDELDVVVKDVITCFIEEYYFDKPEGVEYSFGGLIPWKIKQILYGGQEKLPKNVDVVSLNFQFDDESVIEYEDHNKDVFDEIEGIENSYLNLKFLYEIIFNLSYKCACDKDDWFRLQALYIYLNKGEDAKNKFFEYYDRTGKVMFEITLEIMKQELEKYYNEQ